MAFDCTVIAIADADSLRCANKTRVRIAGIEANERNGTCHIERCPAMPYHQAKAIVWRMTYRRTLRCEALGRSYKRTVARCTFADGRDLRCAVVASGAAVDWPRYIVRYRLGECR